MTKQNYQIVGMPIQIEAPNEVFLETFREFECSSNTSAEMKLSVEPFGGDCACYGVEHYSAEEDYQHILLNHNNAKSGFLLADRNWGVQRFVGDVSEEIVLNDSITAAFYSRLTYFGGLMMHASAVCRQGRSIVFTAPSGTGKTTQAELWHKYLGAEILNGDKVFFREKENRIHAWGSPWRGSSPYSVNSSAPVSAIVVLSQSPTNRLRKLDGIEAVSAFVPHVFYPRWDSACMDNMMQTLDRIAAEIPIYLLECRADKEAVMLLENAL